jgi:hypothetical protein
VYFVLTKHCSREELKTLFLDPRVSFEYRDMILGMLQTQGISREFLFEMATNPGLKIGPVTWTEFHRARLEPEIEKAWPTWICETNPHRAERFGHLFRLTNSIRESLLEQCLASGSETMKSEVFRNLFPHGRRDSIEATFKKVLTHLEQIGTTPEKRPLRVEAYLALNRLNGNRSRKLATDDATINAFIRAERERLDALKNSASQPAPSE